MLGLGHCARRRRRMRKGSRQCGFTFLCCTSLVLSMKVQHVSDTHTHTCTSRHAPSTRCSRSGRTRTRPRLSPPRERRMWTAVGARVVGLRRECMHLIVCTQHAVQRVVQSPTLQQPPPTWVTESLSRGIASGVHASDCLHEKRKTPPGSRGGGEW